ncbi:transposase [Rhodococcus koreensis]|uniref:transposase n=1 Tax=Rhodococcus koreensis TaxID=99653 RepID=UPI00367229EB
MWLATKTDKSTGATFCGQLAHRRGPLWPGRCRQALPEPVLRSGRHRVDEIRGADTNKYLPLDSDHDTARSSGYRGQAAATLGTFFTDALPKGAAQIEAVSMALGPAYVKAVREHAPQATICIGPVPRRGARTRRLDDARHHE